MITILEVLPVDGAVWLKGDPNEPPGWCALVKTDLLRTEVGGTFKGRMADLTWLRRAEVLFVYGEEPPPPIEAGDTFEEEP